MKSVMQHTFSQIPDVKIPRSKFNRSHGLKTSLNEDYLIPILVDEILPGDSFNVKLHALCRLATPLKPIMDNIFLDTFFFFVPNRLVWEHWSNFLGEREDPDVFVEYSIPQITTNNLSAQFNEGDLGDYFGLPINKNNVSVSALPFRAYNLIWDNWFRDQNLQDRPVLDIDDTDNLWDNVTQYPLRKRCKKHDYFTSCLPWAQKGDPVEVVMGTSAPVKGDNSVIYIHNASNEEGTLQLDNSSPTSFIKGNGQFIAGNLYFGKKNSPYGDTGLLADLSTASMVTINSLRQSFQIQKMLERDARGGTRLREVIRNHFGVEAPDYRLQRPELLSMSSTPIMINPIAQTAPEVSGSTAFGQLTGVGVGHIKNGFTKSFVEHGYIIGLANIRADINYQNNINRMWSRETRYDFYWPSLANLGEEAVLNKEIYCKGIVNDDNGVFGYQERYASYRYFPSILTGRFRSDATTPMDSWHLTQEFADTPELGNDFIESNTPISRICAVQSEPHFLLDCYFDQICVRPMPVYSIPGYIDHL